MEGLNGDVDKANMGVKEIIRFSVNEMCNWFMDAILAEAS